MKHKEEMKKGSKSMSKKGMSHMEHHMGMKEKEGSMCKGKSKKGK